jgi:hypothetical protein
MDQFGKSGLGFFFSKSKTLVNPDGSEIAVPHSPQQVAEYVSKLLAEFRKVRHTRGPIQLIHQLLKVYALSRELVIELAPPSMLNGGPLPFVFMDKDGDLEFTDDYHGDKVESLHFNTDDDEEVVQH